MGCPGHQSYPVYNVDGSLQGHITLTDSSHADLDAAGLQAVYPDGVAQGYPIEVKPSAVYFLICSPEGHKCDIYVNREPVCWQNYMGSPGAVLQRAGPFPLSGAPCLCLMKNRFTENS